MSVPARVWSPRGETVLVIALGVVANQVTGHAAYSAPCRTLPARPIALDEFRKSPARLRRRHGPVPDGHGGGQSGEMAAPYQSDATPRRPPSFNPTGRPSPGQGLARRAYWLELPRAPGRGWSRVLSSHFSALAAQYPVRRRGRRPVPLPLSLVGSCHLFCEVRGERLVPQVFARERAGAVRHGAQVDRVADDLELGDLRLDEGAAAGHWLGAEERPRPRRDDRSDMTAPT